MSLEWTESFETGIKSIDRQHMELLTKINRFIDAVAVGADSHHLNEMLDFLNTYVTGHFAHEEDQMKQLLYPGSGPHLTDHEVLTSAIIRFRNDLLARGPYPELADEIRAVLCDWYITHVGGEDQRLGAFISEND